jgi:hypothetical protein
MKKKPSPRPKQPKGPLTPEQKQQLVDMYRALRERAGKKAKGKGGTL